MIDYNKYMTRNVKQVDKDRKSQIKKIAYDSSLEIDNINDLVTADKLEPKIGYHKFKDGSGVACAYTRMDDVTIEMINWWFVFVELDPRNYQIWFPKEHYDMGIPTEEEMNNYLDDSIPYYQRKWGSVSHPTEGIGVPKSICNILNKFGMNIGEVVLNFKRPADIGIDESQQDPNNLKGMVCAISYNGMFDFPVTVLHYMVEDEKGIDYHSRFWFGKRYDGEKFVKEGRNIPMIALKKITKHCLDEFTSLSAIVKELYEQMDGKVQ